MQFKNHYQEKFHIQTVDDLKGIQRYLKEIADKTINKPSVINGKEYNGIGELDITIKIEHHT